MKLILDLDENQEQFLYVAIATAADAAWNASIDIDLSHEEDHTGPWTLDLAAAEAILAQLPNGALRLWREHLHDNGEDEE